MKKMFFSPILLLFVACTNVDSTESSEEVPFNTQKFLMNGYEKRVYTFLTNRPETMNKSDYFALFVNTENCSSCTMNAFASLNDFLHKQQSAFVYINDSVLFNQQEYPNLTFVCLPDEDYKRKNIFHGQMYLYFIEKQKIKSIKLTIHTIDSLNHL